MDSECIGRQYLPFKLCMVLPMQHIWIERRHKDGILLPKSQHKACRYHYTNILYIPFTWPHSVSSLSYRVDLCEDQPLLHEITISLRAWISQDYREITSYLKPPCQISHDLSIQQFVVRQWITLYCIFLSDWDEIIFIFFYTFSLQSMA